MKLSFAKENMSEIWDECKALFPQHYLDVNEDDKVKLGVNEKMYRQMDQMGMIDLYTARSDGILVGYSFFIVQPHMHYADDCIAYNSLLFLHQFARKGMNGYRFIKFCIQKIRERKPNRILISNRPKRDYSRLLKRLGATLFESIYCISG